MNQISAQVKRINCSQYDDEMKELGEALGYLRQMAELMISRSNDQETVTKIMSGVDVRPKRQSQK